MQPQGPEAIPAPFPRVNHNALLVSLLNEWINEEILAAVQFIAAHRLDVFVISISGAIAFAAAADPAVHDGLSVDFTDKGFPYIGKPDAGPAVADIVCVPVRIFSAQ